jgi:hypothetical protein
MSDEPVRRSRGWVRAPAGDWTTLWTAVRRATFATRTSAPRGDRRRHQPAHDLDDGCFELRSRATASPRRSSSSRSADHARAMKAGSR